MAMMTTNITNKHAIIKNMDHQSISLYTKRIKLHRNKKGILLITFGLSVFLGCLYIMSASIQEAAALKRYANSFNYTLLCNITDVMYSNISFEFDLLNSTNASLCNSRLKSHIVKNINDQELLSQNNVSIGVVMPCFTNYKCDHIYFQETNSNHEQSGKMYLYGVAVFFFGCSTLLVTIASFCVTSKRDKRMFYWIQWNVVLDPFSKYEYIANQWSKICNIELCDDIDDLIFEYTNRMDLYDENATEYDRNDLEGEIE
eukprot:336416_1